MKEYKGSILLVSYEPDFYEDWVDSVWNIEGWTTKIIQVHEKPPIAVFALSGVCDISIG